MFGGRMTATQWPSDPICSLNETRLGMLSLMGRLSEKNPGDEASTKRVFGGKLANANSPLPSTVVVTTLSSE